MSKYTALVAVLSGALIFSSSIPAVADSSSRAWGTGGAGTQGRGVASATMHQLESQTARVVQAGSDSINMNRSVQSCGVCTYYQITGDQNSIAGNSAFGTNAGSITANGTFSE